MYYFSALLSLLAFTFNYNFFASYHGQSGCDAAAAHAKKRINLTTRDNTQFVKTNTNLAACINTLTGHSAITVDKLSEKM